MAVVEPEADFSERRPIEQRPNRVPSGFNARQAFEFLEVVASSWEDDQRLLDVILLRALARLSAEDPDQAEKGFDAITLASKVDEVRREGWLRERGGKQTIDGAYIAKKVRDQWTHLVRHTWPPKHEGVEVRFQHEGFSQRPGLDKVETKGGTGNRSLYRILWRPFDTAAPPAAAPARTVADTADATTIVYTPEDVRNPVSLARIFARGYPLSGWRLACLLVLIVSPIVVAFLYFMVALFGLVIGGKEGWALSLQALPVLALLLVVLWMTIWPLIDVLNRQVVVAPWWMQDRHNSRLLEHRHPPRFPTRTIKAVRYTGTCPVCQGRILAVSGGLEFWGRVVGRCDYAPVEHDFSFDHVTRAGKALR